MGPAQRRRRHRADLRRGGLRGAGVALPVRHRIAAAPSSRGAEKSALGEEDAIGTHAQLLAEKRIGFFTLTAGLVLYLMDLVLKSPEGTLPMGVLVVGVVGVGVLVSALWTRFVGRKVRRQAREAEKDGDPEKLPEQ